MTDYIISEEQLNSANNYRNRHGFDNIEAIPLSSALEESYRHGFNDGQAEGLPRPPCEECIYQSQSAEHDAKVSKAERERVCNKIMKTLDVIPSMRVQDGNTKRLLFLCGVSNHD